MDKREITLGHSPDPDDAFMFYALAADRIPTDGLSFRHVIEDIETLNRRAMNAELDVTAISIHAYAYVLDQYALLTSGASMGDDYGPLVISREPMSVGDLRGVTIAIPGEMTTAYLALRLCAGGVKTTVIPFDKIMDAVERGETDAGLLIHEGQLTYAARGFNKVVDLGEWWKSETGLPLPLGGNVIKKSLGQELINKVSALLRESIEYGLGHRQVAVRHSMKYGRGMEESLTDKFVGMYVNDYTIDYGERGREAVRLLLRRGHEAGVIPSPVQLEFA
ncbi:MAG TPA: MqnA/MqnD/SBP family protein [Blastocatellia bacterium]|jgi:1,4-dihydroxy-6-naphthoate synthase|nr:MqnA/MqnD/SBP family protein [Blastocatellia bacterium]